MWRRSPHKDQGYLTNTVTTSETILFCYRQLAQFIGSVSCCVHKTRFKKMLQLGFTWFQRFLPKTPMVRILFAPASRSQEWCCSALQNYISAKLIEDSNQESLNHRIPMAKWIRYTNMASAKRKVEKYVTDSFPTWEGSCWSLFNPDHHQLIRYQPLTLDSIKHAIYNLKWVLQSHWFASHY